MLRDYPDGEAIGGALVGGAGVTAGAVASVGAVGGGVAERPHQMPKWSRRPRNPKSAETRRLIGLAVEARDEAAARPSAKAKALREAAYMRVIVACESMINAYASRFASRELEQDDLVATATLGLIEALNRFDDVKSGGGWTGYVGAWMMWKLQQYTGSQRKPVALTHLEIEQVALLNGTRADGSQWGYKAKARGAE